MQIKDFFEKMNKTFWNSEDLYKPDLSDEVLIVNRGDPLDLIVRILAKGTNQLAAYVVEEGCPVGVIVKDDLLTRVYIPKKDPSIMKVGDIMSTDITVLKESMKFEDLFKQFFEKEYITQPVVNEEGRLRGVMTIFDIARYLYLYSTILEM